MTTLTERFVLHITLFYCNPQMSARKAGAGEEPPYLTVGTDVSAKYRGAFCEAKVKKVTRIVKCKVNFKGGLSLRRIERGVVERRRSRLMVDVNLLGPNGGPCIVTDDNVKGPLIINSVVEAKNPDTNLFQEAVISKLTDCRLVYSRFSALGSHASSKEFPDTFCYTIAY